MSTTTTITTDALLKLMWLASPALPVGGFSYSEGLEAAIESELANTEASAQTWLLDQLRLSLARADLAVVAAAFDAWQQHDAARIAELNAWVTATRETSELCQQAEQMGRSLAEWLRPQGDDRLATLLALRPAPTWPVAFALAGVKSGAPRRELLLAFAFGWAENMIAAAVKAVPLGQTAGQRMLAALVIEIPAAVDHALQSSDDGRQAFTPMLAVLSAQHETQYSRLFRS